MSLQVWLPLNGNLENYGLSNINITNNGATIDNNGKIGKCYYLNGNVLYNTNFSLSTTEFSACCWVKFTRFPSGSNAYCISLNTSTSTDEQFILGIYSADGSSAQFRFNVGNSTGTISLNTWYHLCISYDGSKAYMYIDGECKNTVLNPTIKEAHHLVIGGRSTNSDGTSFNGMGASAYYNDVRIYDHCLSTKEVKELSKGLVLHYLLKDEIGVFSKIYDTSGYLNNGILNGPIINDSQTPRYQRCYHFTPTSYLGIPNQPLNSSSTDFTFCFWMKTNSPAATMCLWNGRNNIGTALGIFALGGTFRYDDGSQRSMTNYNIPINEWHHYVFARNSSNIKFYVDGKLIQTVNSSAFSEIGTNATIGASSINTITGSGNPFSGCLSDYRIYATTLNEKDILELYQTSFQIDNNGNSYAYELIEQE